MLSRMRFSRGPLRWWIMAAGLLLGQANVWGFGGGLLLIVLGASLHVWSKSALWQNRQLSTDGPYRFTRNPFYLANLLIDGGLLAVIGRWEVALPALLAWMWVYRRTIADEEATLRGLFGTDFERYCRRVPRFVPWPGRYLRLGEVSEPRWTWRNPNLASGREWTRVCRVLMCPWLLLTAASLRGQVAWAATGLGTATAIGVAFAWFAAGELLSYRKRVRLRAQTA